MKRVFLLLSYALLVAACGESTIEQTESFKTTHAVDTTALRTVTEQALVGALEKDVQRGHVMVMDVSTGHLILDQCIEMCDGTFQSVAVRDTFIEPAALLAVPILATLFDDPTVELDTAMLFQVWRQTYLDGSLCIKDISRCSVWRDSLPLHTAFANSSVVARCEVCDKYYSYCPDSLMTRIYRLFPNAKANVFTGPTDFYRLCTGYGIRLSPSDILSFYTAIAAGGVDPTTGRRLCMDSTADVLKSLLCEVVERGTARNIHTDAYLIAGNSAMVSNIVLYKQHTSMFVGFFPADKPKFSCLVILEGHTYPQSAAKVFKTISDYLYQNNQN